MTLELICRDEKERWEEREREREKKRKENSAWELLPFLFSEILVLN